MNAVLDLPGQTFATTAFRRKPKIACLHPELAPDRRRAYGQFNLGVRFHEDLPVSLPVKQLASGRPRRRQKTRPT